MLGFDVTYEIITEESAEDGEAADDGFIAENVSLREAIDLVGSTDSCHCERSGIEASDSREDHAQWVTVYNSASWQNGETENRSLHIPRHVTPSSRRRIVRLIKATC